MPTWMVMPLSPSRREGTLFTYDLACSDWRELRGGEAFAYFFFFFLNCAGTMCFYLGCDSRI